MRSYFIVKMSTGFSVSIDQEEMAKVEKAMQSGCLVRLKQGIINGSHISGIIQDKERIKESSLYVDGLKCLPDIFEDQKLIK